METRVLQAPNCFESPSEGPSLFLGGGIGGTTNWQERFLRDLVATASEVSAQHDFPLLVFNPRRPGDFAKTGSEAQRQIEWEFAHLSLAHAHLFWFPSASLCPIALYELGRSSLRPDYRPLFVGCAPEYQRKFDLQVQMELAKPAVEVVFSLEEMLRQVVYFAENCVKWTI